MPATTYYDLLEVPPDADAGAVRKSFMRLAREWHPDKAPDGERDAYESRFKRLSEAYEVVSDPIQRERYDRERAYRSRHRVTVDDREPWRPRTVTVDDEWTAADDWRNVQWPGRDSASAASSPFVSDFGVRNVRTVNPFLSFSIVALVMGLIAIIATIAMTIFGLTRLGRLFRPARSRR